MSPPEKDALTTTETIQQSLEAADVSDDLTIVTQRAPLPVLAAIVNQTRNNGLVEKLQFKTTIFVCTQHLLGTTVNLLESLCDLGALPENIFILGKSYSAIPAIVKELEQKRFQVQLMLHTEKVLKQGAPFYDSFAEDVLALWQSALSALQTKTNITVLLILDDGGRCLLAMPPDVKTICDQKHIAIAGVEQTSHGVAIIKSYLEHHPTYSTPIISVARSEVKRAIESAFIAETIAGRLEELLPMLKSGQHYWCGIIGRGVIGEAVRRKLLKLGHHVLVHDIFVSYLTEIPSKASPEYSKHLTRLEHLFLVNAMLFGCTGRDVTEDLSNMLTLFNESKHLISCSSEEIEFEKFKRTIQQKGILAQSSGDMVLKTEEDYDINLIQGGFPVNFDRTDRCDPAELFQLIRGLLLCGLIQAGLMVNFPQNTANEEKILPLSLALQQFTMAHWLKSLSTLPGYQAFHQRYNKDVFRELFTDQMPDEDVLRHNFPVSPDFDFTLYGSPSFSSDEQTHFGLPPFDLEHFTQTSAMQIFMYHLSQEYPRNPIVLCGDGGVGKTYLTLLALHQPQQDYDLRVFFNAQNPAQLDAEYVELGEKFHLFLSKDASLKVKVDQVKEWLKMKRALLVYDNVESQMDDNYLSNYLPFSCESENKPQIIITSRISEWQDTSYTIIPVSAMTIAEARNLTKQYLGFSILDTDIELFLSLMGTKELGYSPLAITYACAYIIESTTLADEPDIPSKIALFYTLYKENEQEKREILSAETSLNSGHRPVYITWDIVRRDIEREFPLANELLKFCSYLSCRNIPKKLLKSFLDITRANPADTNTQLLEKSLSLLKRFSLIQTDEENISIHPILQDVLSIKLDISSHSRSSYWIEKGILALNAIYPYEKDQMEDYHLARGLVAHGNQLLQHAQRDTTIPQSLTVLILVVIGDAFTVLGELKKAEDSLNHALSIQEVATGSESLEVAKILNLLAIVYLHLNEPYQAKEKLKRTLSIRILLLGDESLEVAKTLVDLSSIFGVLEEIKTQRKLLKRALMIREKHYGPDHIKIAGPLSNLATVYTNLGKLDKALTLLRRALAIEETHYHAEHTNIAITLSHLSNVYKKLGYIYEEKKLLERALKIKENFYGPRHIELSYTLNSLAMVYLELDNAPEATKLLERTLNITQNTPGYRLDATILADLGATLRHLNKLESAREYIEEALRLEREYHGTEHIATITPLQNLATIYLTYSSQKDIEDTKKQEYLQKAKEYLEKALSIIEKTEGHDLSNMAIILDTLAKIYQEEEPEKSRVLLERALNIEKTLYGDQHPKIARILINLANIYGKLNLKKEQKTSLDQALLMTGDFLIQPNYNPLQVATILVNLAGACQSSEYDKTIEIKLLENALDIRTKFYGNNHPKVAIILSQLSAIHYLHDELSLAKVRIEQAYQIIINHPNDVAFSIITNMKKVIYNSLARQYLALGQLYLGSHQLTDAVLLYQKTLELNPKLAIAQGKRIKNSTTSGF